MTPKQLVKIRKELEAMRLNPQGKRAGDFIPYAKTLGRVLFKRGKEPNWVRERDPQLSPPLSIPNHAKDYKVGTARSIIDQLLFDCDTWEQTLLQEENDEQD